MGAASDPLLSVLQDQVQGLQVRLLQEQRLRASELTELRGQVAELSSAVAEHSTSSDAEKRWVRTAFGEHAARAEAAVDEHKRITMLRVERMQSALEMESYDRKGCVDEVLRRLDADMAHVRARVASIERAQQEHKAAADLHAGHTRQHTCRLKEDVEQLRTLMWDNSLAADGLVREFALESLAEQSKAWDAQSKAWEAAAHGAIAVATGGATPEREVEVPGAAGARPCGGPDACARACANPACARCLAPAGP
mmetsp:Transcript_103825/g.294112  ORF Transcript_103825/g.294112 Transcript_103825/m.294112 type:complete len:253 (+) Transcript_103825:74-832(+)